jgi:deoxyribose-phosphate aldolase
MTLHCPGCLFYFSAGANFIDLTVAMVCAAAKPRADMQQAIAGIMTCYVQHVRSASHDIWMKLCTVSAVPHGAHALSMGTS